MNFIEVGLPHTEFVPTKKEFSPRRPIPMSGLSKRYMGLETLSKSELGSLVDRLSQPKSASSNRAQQPKSASSNNDNRAPDKSPTDGTANTNQKSKGRFLGSKKMKKSDLDGMIARLSCTNQSKTPESRRIQAPEERTKRGVTASYAWQGKCSLHRNLTVSNNHTHYNTMLKRHFEMLDVEKT
ncbi:uncharacterized protein LOC144626877 [Crassostrea virginica]